MKRIQQILKLLIVLCSFSLFSVQAGYFSYIVSVTPPETRYHFVMEYWQANSQYPNACSFAFPGSPNCYIHINHLHSGKDMGGAPDRAPWRCNKNIANLPNEAAVVNFLVNECDLHFPFVGYSQHAGAITTDECIGFFLTTSPGGGYGKLVYNGVCGIAPPPEGKCAFKTDKLTLSHGMLDPDQVNNNQVSEYFTVTCNQDMQVKITSSQANSNNYLKLTNDGSISSYITLNNASAASGAIVYARKNEYTLVNITSTLKTSGSPSLGNFSGTTTLVLSIP